MPAPCAWRSGPTSAAPSRGSGIARRRSCARPSRRRSPMRATPRCIRCCRTRTGSVTGASAGRATTTPPRPTWPIRRTRSTASAGSGRGRSFHRTRSRSCSAWSMRPTPTGRSHSRRASTSACRRESFSARLQFTNTAAIEQPAGLGWHPYFVKRARSRLHIELSSRWESDATKLPTRKVAQPGIDSRPVASRLRPLLRRLARPGADPRRAVLAAARSSLPYLVVYTPPDRDYFCVEPVSHVSNAIHMAEPTDARPRRAGAGRDARGGDAARRRRDLMT